MSREARSNTSDSIHNRLEYILGVSGDLGIKIKSLRESGDELLKSWNVSPGNVALASGCCHSITLLKDWNFGDIASHTFNSLPELFPRIKECREMTFLIF